MRTQILSDSKLISLYLKGDEVSLNKLIFTVSCDETFFLLRPAGIADVSRRHHRTGCLGFPSRSLDQRIHHAATFRQGDDDDAWSWDSHPF